MNRAYSLKIFASNHSLKNISNSDIKELRFLTLFVKVIVFENDCANSVLLNRIDRAHSKNFVFDFEICEKTKFSE